MKNLIILLFMLAIISSCGKKIKLEHDVKAPTEMKVTTTSDVNINRNYQDVYDFCDDRYGYMSEDAEQCIDDILRLKVSVDANIDDILGGCEGVPSEEACRGDIVDLLDEVPGLELPGKGRGLAHGLE